MVPMSPEQPPSTAPTRDVRAVTEDVFIRNYDVRQGYDLTIWICDGAEHVYESRFHLTPGANRSVLDGIPPGIYDVTVELDGYRRESCQCAIGPESDRTVLVELGNGTVSVTEGLYR